MCSQSSVGETFLFYKKAMQKCFSPEMLKDICRVRCTQTGAQEGLLKWSGCNRCMCHFVYNEFIKSSKKWSDQNQTSRTGSYSCIVNTVLVSKFPDVNITALMSSFAGAGDVWFSLRNTTYQNNSIVTLEDISKGDDDALLCKTNYSACCGHSGMMPALGNWYFPNGSRVPSAYRQWDIYRTRGQMVVRMYRRRG